MTKAVIRNLFLIALVYVPFFNFAQNDYLVTINPTGPTHLRVGEQCTITLNERELLQGYQWHYAFSDYNKIAKVSEKETSTSRTFVFKAVESGHVRIDLAVYDAKQGKGSIRQKKEYWITVHELNDPSYAEASKSQTVSAERHWQNIKTTEPQPPLKADAASQPKNISKPTATQPTKSSRQQQEIEESSTAVTTTVKSPVKKDKAELQADVARVNRQREKKNESEQNPDNQITTELAKPSPKPLTVRPSKTSEMSEVEIVDGSSIQGQVKPNTKKINEQESLSGKPSKTEKPVSTEPKVITPRKKLSEPTEEELADAVVVNTQTKTVSKPQTSPKPTVENKSEGGSKPATSPSESINVRKIATVTEAESDAPLADATPKAVARPVAKTETPVKPEKTPRSLPVSKESLPRTKEDKHPSVSQADDEMVANAQPPAKVAKPATTHKHTRVSETETRTIKPRQTDEKATENEPEVKPEPKPSKTSPSMASPVKPSNIAPKVITRPTAAVADEPQAQAATPARTTESRNAEMQQSDFEESSLKNTGKPKFDPNYEATPQPTQKTQTPPAKISETDNSTYAAFHRNAKILTWQRENIIGAGEEFCVDFYNNIPDARWVHDYDNKNFVYEEDRIFAGATVAAGLPDIHSFRFRTLQKGRYTLTFHLFSKTNPQIDKYVNYEIWVK